jgi:hypothetical protein
VKKQIKKLHINRETPEVLKGDLKGVLGGAYLDTFRCTERQSVCWCYT